MVRVCQIGTTKNRYDSRILLKQSVSLVKAGFEVCVIVTDNLPYEIYEGVEIIPLGFVPKNRFERFFKLYKPLLRKSMIINADIYQINGPENLKLALELKNIGKKVVFDSREDHPADISEKEWIPFGLRNLVSSCYKKYEDSIFRRMDALFAPTTFLLDKLKKINSNSYMVTNYPIINDKNDINVLEDLNKRENAVCFMGTMSDVDMHENVIKALKKIEDTKYIIAATKKSAYTDKLIHISSQLSLAERVEIVGPMPEEQLPVFYARAKAGIVIRSYAANYGFKEGSLGVIKFFDYLSNGLPVICTDFNVWKKIIKEYNCGICVNPYSIEEIAGAINYINDNPEELELMSKNARKAAVEKYNWKSQEEVYVKTYKDLS